MAVPKSIDRPKTVRGAVRGLFEWNCVSFAQEDGKSLWQDHSHATGRFTRLCTRTRI